MRFAPTLLRGLLVGAALGSSCTRTDLVAFDVRDQACSDPAGCPAPGGCVARSCTNAATKAEFCAARSSPVEVGDGCSAQSPSSQSFRFAICSCTDLVTAAALQVDGPAPTALAVNGALRVQSANIDASVLVGGALSSSGSTAPTITGKLTEHAPAACLCDSSRLFDVSAAVSARVNDNDDAALKFEKTELDAFSGVRELDLLCGRYYLTRIAGDAGLHIRVHGQVALFVAGNIELDDELVVSLDSAAQFSLFVAGNLRVAGRLEVTTPDAADAAHLIMGGEGTVDLGSETSIIGTLYAPRAELVTRGRFELSGALFVRRAAPGAELLVHYDPSTGDPAANGCDSP